MVHKSTLFVNGGGGGGTITSVFGRTGPAITAQASDYAAYYGQLTANNTWTGQNTFEDYPVYSYGQVGPNIVPGQNLSFAYDYAGMSYVINDGSSHGFLGAWSQGNGYYRIGAFDNGGQEVSCITLGDPVDQTITMSTRTGPSLVVGGYGAGVLSGAYIRVGDSNTTQGTELGDNLGANLNVYNGSVAVNLYATGGVQGGVNPIFVVYDNNSNMGQLSNPAFQITRADMNGYGDCVQTISNMLDYGNGQMGVGLGGSVSGGTPNYALDIFDYGGTGTDIGNSTTGKWRIQANGQVRISNNTQSTSTGTGAIIVSGGIGLAGNIHVGGEVFCAASTTSAASLNIPSGTAPTSPASGDMWFNGTHLEYRIGSTTYQLDQQVTTGINIRGGTSGAMTSGSVTVSDSLCTANSLYFFTTNTLGTITGPVSYRVSSRSAGTSFTIQSQNAIDTSTVNWVAIF